MLWAFVESAVQWTSLESSFFVVDESNVAIYCNKLEWMHCIGLRYTLYVLECLYSFFINLSILIKHIKIVIKHPYDQQCNGENSIGLSFLNYVLDPGKRGNTICEHYELCSICGIVHNDLFHRRTRLNVAPLSVSQNVSESPEQGCDYRYHQ